jgi:hypothetical protein
MTRQDAKKRTVEVQVKNRSFFIKNITDGVPWLRGPTVPQAFAFTIRKDPASTWQYVKELIGGWDPLPDPDDVD